ncbi:FecCD family ABC transporter permease [Deinococcus yavapaiensis]|uniref:Iron complex transport system permease protein n=1 Tax=Deinococcus yavapaiensis KR-236 TaxID=694435 RepID=A0A318S6L2_9DEIO|nr:iron ABC transporter permease [Deinococcus yavapaiensis]PYE50030.1 iron complex transport system permease protein [Deinococcus yavapaiensis KR-236]
MIGARGRQGGKTILLLVALAATVLLGVGLGSVWVPPLETLHALFKGVTGAELSGSEIIVWQLRFPRVVLGLLVGGILATCGGAFQGVFRNPLADPYLMGVASGAYLGVTIAVVRSLSSVVTPVFAMTGALLSVLVTLALARQGRTFPPTRLILAGVVVGSIVTAVSTFLMLRGQDRVRQVFTATLGNLALGGWPEVRLVALYGAVGVGMVLLLARALNTVQLGDATARSLGVPVERLRLMVILAASVATAGAVSFAGIIGFVGLVTPHIVRRVWSADFRVLLPMSALAGGTLLVLADLLARTLTRPAELPVGIVTTLLGGPFFLYLLRKTR